MILYHGSYLQIDRPDISFSRANVDFGPGFYTTPIKEQAISWSARFKRKFGESVVSAYEINESALRTDVSILEFTEYDNDWLDFIVSCRRGLVVGEFDVIIGAVANDKVFDTIQLLLDGFIDGDAAINRLRYEEPNIQYCFRSQSLIDKYIRFISSEVFM